VDAATGYLSSFYQPLFTLNWVEASSERHIQGVILLCMCKSRIDILTF
jgi:hypothetical protein